MLGWPLAAVAEEATQPLDATEQPLPESPRRWNLLPVSRWLARQGRQRSRHAEDLRWDDPASDALGSRTYWGLCAGCGGCSSLACRSPSRTECAAEPEAGAVVQPC